MLNTLDVEISFDDKALSKYTISISKTFKTADEAIIYLLKDKPYIMEKVGSVYVISPKQVKNSKSQRTLEKKKFIISGQLLDENTGEPLPYSYIQTTQGVSMTDESGYFSIVQHSSQSIDLQIQYIGYQALDTILSIGKHLLRLTPKELKLGEVVVSPSPSAMLVQSGKTSGETRINHQIAQHLPGSADNSTFNLLRMMPGVRASGEPSDDLIVWGNNWGESRLVYDGFTIFGLKSFNDQISSVNPYLAKDIRLLKGGYDASQGHRIGAIAEITGNEGDFDKPSIKANVSNYTANIYASVPFKKTSALSVAYRQTFYNMYKKTEVEESEEEHNSLSSPDIFIEPKYDFRDLNVKYAGKAFENDRYYISLYGADDHFESSINHQSYEVDAVEKNRQYGAAANYNRVWNNGNTSKFLFSFSKLQASIDNVSGITEDGAGSLDVFHIKNDIQEFSFNLEHNVNVGERQKIQIGGNWQQYRNAFNKNKDQINVPSLYLTDNIKLNKLSLQVGLRTDWVLKDKVHLQPRLSARYKISEELTATTSFGLYNQYLTRVPFQYRTGSFQMIWNLSDSASLKSTHYLAGLAYSKNGWLLSMEGYVKKNKNQSYFLDNDVLSYNNRLLGVDLYAKKEWNNYTAFASYSLVNSTKPQKTTGQEIKLGAIASYKKFHLSATYVYGDGFPYLATAGHGHDAQEESGKHDNEQGHSETSSEPYSRFDLSLTYKFYLKNVKMQAGGSILNVFDTDNVKYSYRLSNQNNVFNIYTKATPFTPIAFFEIIF